MTIEHRLESILQNLKRDELNIVARKLKVKAYRKYNQKKIISIILTEADQKNLRKLLKITWWDKWHNHFYGFATILALLLAVLFYMFPRESPTETNSAEIQKETLDIVKRMKQRRKTDHEELIKKYPEGYYLFAADGYKTIPDQQVRSRFSLDPDNSKILLVNNSIIHLLLKSFVYKPNDIEFEFLNILLDNQEGTVADGLSFENIGLYLELIEINVNEIIYVIGFRKVESIPKSRKLKPKFKSYLKKQHMSSISWIDMSERKFWKFIGMTITSGWYID